MSSSAPPSRTRADSLVAFGLTLAFGGLYLRTLCPTVFWYDSAEYAAVAATLGIAHPPGYPLYTLLGHLFVSVLPGEPAWALNVMSAVFGAVSIGLSYLVGRGLSARPLGAMTGAATLGATALFWHNAVVAEVYTPALAALLGAILLLLRARAIQRSWPTLLAAGLAGAALGLHYFVATAGVGLMLWALGWEIPAEIPLRQLPGEIFARARLGRRGGRALLLATVAAVAAVIVFSYLPLRSAMEPAINPNKPHIAKNLWWMIGGGNYGRHFAAIGFGAGLSRLGALLADELLPAGLALALTGLIVLTRRRALDGVALLALIVGNTLAFLRYQVHDAQVFFLPTIAALALAIGPGVDAAVAGIGKLVGEARPLVPRLVGAVFVLTPAALLVANVAKVDRSSDTAARDYGEQLCRDLPRSAVIVHFAEPTEWKHDAVFSMYYQRVLGRRRDVRVLQYPQPRHLLALLRRGQRVYLYARIPRVEGLFVLRAEGKLWRLVGPQKHPRWIER